MTAKVSRRAMMQTLTGVVPLTSAPATAPRPKRLPRFFSAFQYRTLQALCQAIIPPDERSGGAREAGVPEFIDLLASENPTYQHKLGGGLVWLDLACRERYGKVYLDCSAAEQKEMLELIAYRENARRDPSLGQGARFFSFLRDLTLDGYFTSKIGIKDLNYKGNSYLAEFPGCPSVPEIEDP